MKFCYVAYLVIIAAESIIGLNLGENNVYQYEVKVVTGNDMNTVQNVGYYIFADAYVSVIWENVQRQEKLLKLQLENLEYKLIKENSAKIPQSSMPVYVEKRGAQFGNVYSDQRMDSFQRGLYKGIASIFHYEKENVQLFEQDVSGTCTTSYFRNGKKIEKVKSNCKHVETKLKSDSLRSVHVNVESRTIYEIDSNNDLQEVFVDEKVDAASNLWRKGNVVISSQTKMKKKGETSKATVLSGNSLEEVMDNFKRKDNVELFESKIYDNKDTAKSQSKNDVINLVKGYQKYLRTENLAKLSSASAFLKLLKYFREITDKDIKAILENNKLQSIHPQILDLLAFGGAPTSSKIVFEALKDKRDSNLIERYLLGLSLIPHPTNNVIEQVIDFLNYKLENKIKASALSTLGALIKTATSENNEIDDKVLEAASERMKKGFKECTSDDCRLMYLRGLRNAALPSATSMLIAVVDEGGQQALEAIRAVQNIGFRNKLLECQRFCEKTLKQPNQGTSTKATAAEILLECALSDKALLKNIIATLDLEEPSEYSAFLASKLMRKVEENEKLRFHILNLLADKDIKNYFSIFQKGSSASFAKPLIFTHEVNSTYGIDMEMLPGGLLKKSLFNIKLMSQKDELNLISVGIFAEGMNSFVGESSGGGNEESPSAGLELGILGVALRPYVFFESSSELMGHVWSGTASEPTPALQGNILITDHFETVILQNGLRAQLQLQGALSADLSGAIQISIWNRNSNSQVENKVAFLMINSITIEGMDSLLENEIKYRGETAIDFLTYFEFYEAPYKMCLQMMQPDFQFLTDRRKYISLNKGKLFSKKNKKTKTFVPARSYALHQQNSELCSRILSD